MRACWGRFTEITGEAVTRGKKLEAEKTASFRFHDDRSVGETKGTSEADGVPFH